MKIPLINWYELQKMVRPALPTGGKHAPKHSGYGAWDSQANSYNQMTSMEASFTLNQINCFDTAPTDTVLDVCCGPGRITVPMAKRAKSVTALDSSPKMLEYCMSNVKAEGLNNVNPVLLDWNEVIPGENVAQHDIVICSRNAALNDIEKLSVLARKYVVRVIWYNNAPSIPQIISSLFEGTGVELYGIPPQMDRRLGSNVTYNMIYDLGYDVNVNIVPDGFIKNYANKGEAYADLRRLQPDLPEESLPIFQSNVDKFLTPNDKGGVTYLSKTHSVVHWWSPQKSEF